ncbi:hypothetical protein BJX68DRAFT_269999 [Aspergillus pseudodeflectus]|uniref:Uncharacterized protein n=1 Tax=Aspergillus pseudodeflectus TaxID=176178 RepID=A0ABR4JUV7_9EURO
MSAVSQSVGDKPATDTSNVQNLLWATPAQMQTLRSRIPTALTMRLHQPSSWPLFSLFEFTSGRPLSVWFAAVGTLSDGYLVQMSGSIVALPGSVRTFGDLQPDGSYNIDPQYISLELLVLRSQDVLAMRGAGIGSYGSGPYPADKFGRR